MLIKNEKANIIGTGVAVSAYPLFSIPGGTLKLVLAYHAYRGVRFKKPSFKLPPLVLNYPWGYVETSFSVETSFNVSPGILKLKKKSFLFDPSPI